MSFTVMAAVMEILVHMVRNSLKFVPFKDRKAIAADLKKIYSAPSEEAAADELEAFSKWWTMPIRDWGSAMNQFAILYGDRVPL